jgi:hypothetical protein
MRARGGAQGPPCVASDDLQREAERGFPYPLRACHSLSVRSRASGGAAFVPRPGTNAGNPHTHANGGASLLPSMAGLARANQPVKNPPPSSDFFREYPGRVWGEWGPMMASASGLPPFLCVATTGAGEVEPKISSTSCERGAWRASVPLKHAPRGRSVEVLDLRAVSAHSGRAGGRTGRQREWQGWQGGTTLSLTTCCVLMAYGGSSGLSFFEGGGCGQACGGQNGAGRQRAAAWK